MSEKLKVLLVRTLCLLSVGVVSLPAMAHENISTDGLVLWLVADDTNGDGASDTDADGFQVARWADKSGRGNHVMQELDDRQPALKRDGIGGSAALRFDGGDSLELARAVGLDAGDQAFHALFVMKAVQAAPQTNPRLLALQGNAPNSNEPQRGFWIGYQGNGRNRVGIHGGDEGEATRQAWNDKPNLVEAVYEGGQRWAHYLNGQPNGSGTFGNRTSLGFREEIRLAIGQHVGATHANTYYRGDLAEVLVYNRVLSQVEQNAIGAYLQKKYSLMTDYGPPPNFEQDIAPILAAHCHACHGGDTQEASLDLRTVTAMLRGGDSGPAVVRGRPQHSGLFEMVSSGKMPPRDADQEPLSDKQQKMVEHWIRTGLAADERVVEVEPSSLIRDEDRAFWVFQKLAKPKPPLVNARARVVTAIDSFVLAKLEAKQLTLAPEADRATLARRTYYDLLGLPPSPAQVQEFLDDTRSDAYERLIDGLLASPHFGERWGRAWLDWSGYVDTYGTDNDAGIINVLDGKWKYRDYVVRSFNADKPLHRFITEQLAGDELFEWKSAETFTPTMRDALVATTFLLSSADSTSAPELNTLDERHGVLQRTSEIVANALLGLTLQCAKCHNHKYEAISQLDYYRWQAIFSPAFDPQRWVTATEHGMADVSPKEKAEIDELNADINQQVDTLKKTQEQLRAEYREKLIGEKLKELPQPIRADVRAAVAVAMEKRNEVQKYLATTLGEWATVSPTEVEAAISAEDKATLAAAEQQIATLQSQKKSYETIQVVRETSTPSPTYVLRRGEHLKPSREVGPGILSILTEARESSQRFARRETDLRTSEGDVYESTGRRLDLAAQLTNADSVAGAIMTRVFVNRVWQQLLGEGIVATSDNFGVSGARPTHPELLDWLTAEFVESDWKVKPLVKRIMMSSVYRQASYRATADVHAEETDPANQLLWKARLRRLDSEAVRDAILTVSGKLDRTVGGPPLPLKVQPDGKVIIDASKLSSPNDAGRRSIYVLARRNYHLSMLATFDQPVVATNCSRRQPSAVVTQSLTLLNDDFVLEQANVLAHRVLSAAADSSVETYAASAFEIALGREPKPHELEWCHDLLIRHTARYQPTGASPEEATAKALAHLCQMLFNTNEFLYVE